MALTENQKILGVIVLVFILAYVVYRKCNQNNQPIKQNVNEYMENVSADSDNSSTASSGSTSGPVPSTNVSNSVDTGSATASAVRQRPLTEINRGKNANRSNVRKDVSYGANTYPESRDPTGRVDARGSSGDIDRFFMDGDVDNATENREFSPNDDVSDKLAAYIPKKTDEGLLPVEEKDWFEDVTPTRIKNRHLINIYRPVGVNTISTSLKNPSLDIRGNPANPKTVVSPFLNSSIEPDHNIRGLCVD
jgi:hypothetical protein